MLSLRRYGMYFGLALFILFAVNYFSTALTLRDSPFPASGAELTELQQQQVSRISESNAKFRWADVPVKYPVTSLTPLPTEAPKKLPPVQYNFLEETPEHRETRLSRQASVRQTFERCWNAYKAHAWGHDELAPLSGGASDVFGGWAATLVDNLDTLWIMGLKDEFEFAVQTAVKIDLSQVTLETINVFETTIRHLGGFLSAYDLSGDTRLLEKAKEFGEMLLVAFDTPNRMPITRWNPQNALNGKQVADTNVLVAEIGSLTMEFTRLSQVTGDPRWYDAVNRITQLFAQQQDKTLLKGMWPVTVNAKEADFTKDTQFTLSAMSDSLYEYFPKMHALLGGVDPVYRKLYDGSMGTAIKYNIFRPMVPGDADILVSGSIRAREGEKPTLDPQGQHLVCFAGGMFALGSKLFNQPSHLDVGRKLTDGCIWTYEHMPLGIMPEVFTMIPCTSKSECAWNETLWKERVEDMHAPTAKADDIIKEQRLQPGFARVRDRRYILRPEAIESVFLLYRITGNKRLEESAWEMFTAIISATHTPLANAALSDITYYPELLSPGGQSIQKDSMESFWMAETLKYFYLIFSSPKTIHLDEWVFNTEAHPFRRPVPA